MAWHPSLRVRAGDSQVDGIQRRCIAAAGASWAVFMICNVFSTLWIFPGLWWFPGAEILLIVLLSSIVLGRPVIRAGLKTFIAALALAAAGGAGLYATGIGQHAEVRVSPAGDRPMVITSARLTPRKNVLFLPERSVLGDVWGKEIRRLVEHEEWENKAIIPLPGAVDLPWRNLEPPVWIIACGNRFGEGFQALERFPSAMLVLLHPSGKPPQADGSGKQVILMLPMLDTRYSGRAWKVVAKQQGWNVVTSPGVGQDIRPIWPAVLDDVRLSASHPRTHLIH
jgi:hypothetical protein